MLWLFLTSQNSWALSFKYNTFSWRHMVIHLCKTVHTLLYESKPSAGMNIIQQHWCFHEWKLYTLRNLMFLNLEKKIMQCKHLAAFSADTMDVTWCFDSRCAVTMKMVSHRSEWYSLPWGCIGVLLIFVTNTFHSLQMSHCEWCGSQILVSEKRKCFQKAQGKTVFLSESEASFTKIDFGHGTTGPSLDLFFCCST